MILAFKILIFITKILRENSGITELIKKKRLLLIDVLLVIFIEGRFLFNGFSIIRNKEQLQ